MNGTILQHVWCELRRRKARTLTTVLGYGLAVSSLMVLVGVLQISGKGSAAILDHTGTHFVAFSPASNMTACAACAPFITPFTSQMQNEGLVAFGTRANLMPYAYIDKIRGLPTVADAAPYLQYRFRDPNDGHLFTVGGFNLHDPMVVGTTCCAATDVIKGRFLDGNDRDKLLLEQAYARLRRLDVGSTVRIADQTLPYWGSSIPASDRPRRISTCPTRRRSNWWPLKCPMSPSPAGPI